MSTSNAPKAPTPQPQSSSQQQQTTTATSTTTTTTTMRAASANRATSLGKDQSSFSRHSSSHNGGRSPVSPSRVSRLQEKEEMQNLNDRLAIYIETVRRLESDNNQLRMQASRYEETAQKEVHEIKHLYESELDEAKRLIDELAKEKAKLEIEMNKHKAEADEAVAKLAKRDKEAKGWEARTRASEAQALEFKSRYEALAQQSKDNEEELSQLRPAHKELEKQLNKLKKQLEDETLTRVDLENKNQTLKEDLTFKSSVYDKEIMQMRTSKRVEVEQADLRARDEYESKLVAELQRIREEAEDKIQEMKDDVERRYMNKLSMLFAYFLYSEF
jgi:lamin B